MKTTKFSYRLFSTFAVVLGIAALGACNKPLTKSDVQDDLEDAREATQEAQEETKEAYEAREQYYNDFRETKVKELEDRSSKIDDRIAELKKVSKKSDNQAAVGDIDSAVQELQDEKAEINEQITAAQSIKEEDWSESYEEINTAISKIEGEIDKLSQSLESNN